MKKINLYVCECCGTQYKELKKCKECEDGHVKPVKIVGDKFVCIKNNKAGYPTEVYVQMEDGVSLTYRR